MKPIPSIPSLGRIPFSERVDHGIDRTEHRQERSNDTGGGSALTHPFQIQKVDANTINVRYGTCQDFAPTNVATDIDVSGTDTYTVYLDAEVNLAGATIAVTLNVATGGQPADSDYHGYITLGTVVVASDVITTINQAATHSLRMAVCNRVVDGEALTTRGKYEFWGF